MKKMKAIALILALTMAAATGCGSQTASSGKDAQQTEDNTEKTGTEDSNTSENGGSEKNSSENEGSAAENSSDKTSASEAESTEKDNSQTTGSGSSSGTGASAEQLYADVLDFYYYNIKDNWKTYQEDVSSGENGLDDVSVLFLRDYDSADSVDKVGYMFTDVDNDGNQELIISTTDSASSGLIYDMFTCENGIYRHIASSAERISYTLCKDGSITDYGSSSAAVTLYASEKLNSEGGLDISEAVLYDGMTDENNPWFYGSSSEFSQSALQSYSGTELNPVSEDKANEIMDGWAEEQALTLNSFADYTPSVSTPVYSLADLSSASADTSSEESIDDELEAVAAQAQKIEDKIQNEDLSQTEYNQLSADEYKIWDDELNSIWKRIKTKLSTDDMEKLTQEERAWIAEKDKQVDKAGSEYEGGSLQAQVENLKAAELTKSRVYELAGYLR